MLILIFCLFSSAFTQSCEIIEALPSLVNYDWYCTNGTLVFCTFAGITCQGTDVLAFEYLNAVGYLPGALGNLTTLQTLELHGGNLTGTIPTELFGATSLLSLVINFANISGTIPTEIGQLLLVTLISFQQNQLSGTIPTEIATPKLRYLGLQGNNFTGTIPTELGAILFKNIGTITIDYPHSLCGPVPCTSCVINGENGQIIKTLPSCNATPSPSPSPSPSPFIIPTPTPTPTPTPCPANIPCGLCGGVSITYTSGCIAETKICSTDCTIPAQIYQNVNLTTDQKTVVVYYQLQQAATTLYQYYNLVLCNLVYAGNTITFNVSQGVCGTPCGSNVSYALNYTKQLASANDTVVIDGCFITVEIDPTSTLFWLIGLCLGVFFMVIFVLLIAWLVYSRRSVDLSILPANVKWSFEQYQLKPFTWSQSDDKSYYFKTVTTTEEYGRLNEILATYGGADNNLIIDSADMIYNPTLLSNFVGCYRVQSHRMEAAPTLFNKKTWILEDESTHRQAVHDTYTTKAAGSDIVAAFHATDYSVARSICRTGFATLATIDAGWYGRGIYTSTHVNYVIPYMMNRQEPALIVTYVIPGNVYPVIESTSADNNLIGSSIIAGYNSHYICVNSHGQIPMKGLGEYDELVVPQESQIVPAYIVRYHRSNLTSFDEKRTSASYTRSIC
jgi:hypothetical protein